MVRRETDIFLIEKIANSDEVRPFIRPDGERMDFSPLANKPATQTGVVVLSNGEDAIGLFEITHDGIYQAHTLFAKTCRGRKAIETAREMLAWMFDHGARIIWGCTPRINRAAVMFNRLVGAREISGDAEDAIFEYRRPV